MGGDYCLTVYLVLCKILLSADKFVCFIAFVCNFQNWSDNDIISESKN